MSIALGISSRVTADGLHIPMIDYDEKNYVKVYFDCIKLIKVFKLSDCFVYKTKNGYHAIFYYDLMSWDKAYKIILRSNCDWMFKSLTGKFKKAVLRVGGKYTEPDIQPYSIISSPYRPAEIYQEFGQSLINVRKEYIEGLSKVIPQEVLLK